ADLEPFDSAAAHILRVDVAEALIAELDGPALSEPIAAEHLPGDRRIVIDHARVAAFVVGRADGNAGVDAPLGLLAGGRQDAHTEQQRHQRRAANPARTRRSRTP